MDGTAHIADLQAGFNRFDGRLSRRRERDFYNAWRAAADFIADSDGIENVLLAGDIYEHSSPSMAAQVAVIDGLITVLTAGKRVIITSGNHETPRSAETTHPLEGLSKLSSAWENLHVVFESAESVAGFRVVPWIWGQPITEQEVTPGPDDEVLVLHAPCPVLEEFRHYDGRMYKVEMGENYEYVALGDFHKPVEISSGQWYCGSLERTSFGQEDAECGFNIVRPDFSVERWKSPARTMQTINLIDDSAEIIEQKLAAYADDLVNDNLYRFVIAGVDPTEVDPQVLTSLRQRLPLSKIVFSSRPAPPALVDFGPATMLEQWRMYAEEAELDDEEFESGKEVLEEAMEDV